MNIPPKWIEAGAKALRDEQHSTEMPWEQLDANSKSLYREDTQRALAAVLPLIVRDMTDYAGHGNLQFHVMLRAWARERGFTATTTPEPQAPSTLD